MTTHLDTLGFALAFLSPQILAASSVAPVPPGGGPSPSGAVTPFDAQQHGFRFTNAFEGDLLVDVPLIGQVDLGDSTYGLCGGMSWAAFDGFAAGADAPPGGGPYGTQPPESGTPLRSYLYERQVDSLEADDAYLVRTLLARSWRPVQTSLLWTGLLELSQDEFAERIAPALDAGQPVTLCIIQSDIQDYLPSGDLLGPEGFAENHQVLAIGYRRCADTAGMQEHWGIDVYDPNHPRAVCTLHVSEDGRAQTLKVGADGALVDEPDDPTRNVLGSFRGFFVTPGEPRQPYWAAGNGSLAQRLRDMAITLPAIAADGDAKKPLPGSLEEARAAAKLLAETETRLARLQDALNGLEAAVAAAESRGRALKR